LVLVAPINPWSPRGRGLAPFISRPLGSFLFRNLIERWRVFDRLWLRRLFGDAAKIPADSLEGYRMPVRKNRAFRYARQVVKTWIEDLNELEVALPNIRDYPTLLIWGSRDGAVSVRSAERLRRNFRNCKLVVFEGVGHLPYEEAPEEFNRVLIEFLSSSK
jgi:pimeloyl-ACP methyl ester carboxylesterase